MSTNWRSEYLAGCRHQSCAPHAHRSSELPGIDLACLLREPIGSDAISLDLGSYVGTSAEIGDDGFIIVQSDLDGDGVLLLPSASSIDPGGVYCLDEATIVDQGGQWDVSVTALSRAGALPGTPVAGAVDIEYCFPY